MSRSLPRRYMRFSLVILVLLAILLAPGVAARPLESQAGGEPEQAAAPEASAQPVISYQGRLTDETGAPINATLEMIFALHSAAEGSALVWGPETQTITVEDGEFTALLGSVTPIDAYKLSAEMWLDITVNGEQLTPRERITEVPYAFEARSVAPWAHAKGTFGVDGNLFVISPDSNIYGLHLKRTDEADRTHEWVLWHMNDEYGRNSLQLFEYRADSTGKMCDGNANDGAMCDKRAIMWPGGDVCLGCWHSSWETWTRGRLTLQSEAVPLVFKESDNSGAGSLWRMPVNDGQLRFDVSQNGVDFTDTRTAFRLSANGTMTCGALAESNLQTPKERAAGGTDRFEEGDVLCWGIDQLEKCAQPNDRLVQAVSDAGGNPIVIGAELVKVVGPVKRGDILVASGVAGYAMVNNDPAAGGVIAQALEDFDGERGIIKAMIRKF